MKYLVDEGSPSVPFIELLVWNFLKSVALGLISPCKN
jgi:hypothetical protein